MRTNNAVNLYKNLTINRSGQPSEITRGDEKHKDHGYLSRSSEDDLLIKTHKHEEARWSGHRAATVIKLPYGVFISGNSWCAHTGG